MTEGRLFRAGVVAIVAGVILTFPHAADAGCHSFSVTASPSSVAEGGKVTVTVSRDNDVAPSDVHVSTIDESAKAPADYTKLDQQVEFESGTSKKLTITIADDAGFEGVETFRVHLSDPGGCAVNPNYQVGPDAKVTIQASDQAPPPTPPPAGRTTAAPATTAPPTATPSPTATGGPTPTPTPTLGPLAATEDDGGGFPVGALIGAIAGAIAVGAGAWLLWYRRRAA